jgi:hypothetical protein
MESPKCVGVGAWTDLEWIARPEVSEGATKWNEAGSWVVGEEHQQRRQVSEGAANV